MKRTQQSWISGGGGEEKIYWRRPNSLGIQSVERPASTSTSVYAQQKMKAIGAVEKTLELSPPEIQLFCILFTEAEQAFLRTTTPNISSVLMNGGDLAGVKFRQRF
jgi:hypothetical protein